MATIATMTLPAGSPAPEPVRTLNFDVPASLFARVEEYAYQHRLRRAPALRVLLNAALLAADPVDQAAAGQLPGQTAITP
jgi:hypothetical protein